ncbi:Toprim-like protein [compost metagenome]
MPANQAEHDLAAARGFAVGALLDQPADTRLKPGKPYDLPVDADRVALLAVPLPPEPAQQRGLDVEQKQGRGAAVSKARKSWTRVEQQRETQAIRERIDLREHAERLGYVQVSGSGARVRLENKALDKTDPMREITLRTNARGEPSWIAVKGGAGSGLGGDLFHLHQHVTGQTFLETRDMLRRLAFGRDFEAGAQYRAASTVERAARAEQVRQQENLQNEFRRARAYKQYRQTTERPNALLASRGISERTLAETRWRTDQHGNAVFPHVRTDGKFAGFERKQDGPALFSKSERGVYVANPGCLEPERIKVAEGGLDALSLYQLDSPEEQASTLYVSSGGNPAEDTARALRGLSERTGASQIELVYDQDQAGTNHTQMLRALLAEHAPQLEVNDHRNHYPMRHGEDPNDLLRRLQSERQVEWRDLQRTVPEEQPHLKEAPEDRIEQEQLHAHHHGMYR